MNGNNNNTRTEANVVDFDGLDGHIKKLIREAVEARKNAYCPYSSFAVGACLETDDGALYRGCNCENASYTVGTCAERCAFFAALCDGRRRFRRIAVVAHQDLTFTTPCGACRQFMGEFGGGVEVYLSKPEMRRVLVTSVGELLPFGFEGRELAKL